MADILNQIAQYKRKEVEEAKANLPEATLKTMIATQPEPRKFLQALQTAYHMRPALIAEIKKASPSKGLIRDDFHPPALAKAYEDGGASCLSVLTDGPSFQGSNLFLKQAKVVTSLPVLRKDFLLDPYQVYESRALGADCVLLIMAMIDDGLAKHLFALAYDLGMDVLVEVHDERELERALALNPPLIGINNRNLKTFETSLLTFKRLAQCIPNHVFLVAESGIFTPDDLIELTSYGAQGFLIGESLMRKEDVKAATHQLVYGF